MLRLWNRLRDKMFPFKCVFDAPTKPTVPLDLPIELWLEIFQFSTYVHQEVSIRPLDPFTVKHVSTNAMGANTPSLAMKTKLAIVLVSRAWRRVGLQLLYQHIAIRSPARASMLLRNLQTSQFPLGNSPTSGPLSPSAYGQFARHLEVFTYTRGSNDIKYLQLIFQILRLCPNLRTLSGRWIHSLPVEFLDALAVMFGPTLSELYWSERQTSLHQNTNTNLTFLSAFQSLRVLDLRHFVGTAPSSWPVRGSGPSLPFVHSIILSSHTRSLEAATRLNLPSLRNLTLMNSVSDGDTPDLLKAFLRAHGKSLVMIDLPTPSVDSEPHPDNALSRRTISPINPNIFMDEGVCPNLETLVLSVNSPIIAHTYSHRNLRRIGLCNIHVDGLYPEKTSTTRDHLMSFNVEKYPQLETIQTINFLVEANSDSLAKDIFIWWVERFEAMNVLLVDGEGVMWAYHPDASQDEGGTADRAHIECLTKTILATNDLKKSESNNRTNLKDAKLTSFHLQPL